ncbi:InlB B-repeat-containing protein [Geotalea uraniireducens]|uniref:InlB B-repeat-containing protein n=1 Tax=Geotalea uraniireducens TaxID=351604 RepID=UPI00006BC90A|nr:hypothetical protein [Geotalea uraniireducens]
MNKCCLPISLLLTVLLAATAVGAPLPSRWNGAGPFANGLGDRAITALAISDDGTAVFAGTGSGTGSGTVATPGCGFGTSGGCAASDADTVTLTATPANGSTFSGWSGGTGSASACSGNGSCTFAAGQDSSVAATFTLNPHNNVTPAAGANGSIAPNTPQSVNYGATTQFTVTPAPHYHIASVTGFIIPASATSLTVAISSFTAGDDSGVAGYLVSESGSQPAADATGWSVAAPTGYTFSSQGSKILYAFAKDAAGNVSAPAPAAVVITLSDSTAPTVVTFTLPVTLNSLTVAVTSFTASDAVGVTGYLLSESASATANSGNWTSTPTSSYTFATAGAKILYAFAKDAAGNVSAAAGVTVTITLPDITAPTVTGFSVSGSTTSLIVTVSNFMATDDTAVHRLYYYRKFHRAGCGCQRLEFHTSRFLHMCHRRQQDPLRLRQGRFGEYLGGSHGSCQRNANRQYLHHHGCPGGLADCVRRHPPHACPNRDDGRGAAGQRCIGGRW